MAKRTHRGSGVHRVGVDWKISSIPVSDETKAFLEYMAELERRLCQATLCIVKKKEK